MARQPVAAVSSTVLGVSGHPRGRRAAVASGLGKGDKM